eukprot:TRINITY_DN3022_c0_g1_i2.p1 TRINITY_DN3022_c0_g1~~TRINITY_DN3022_c0_g1_i2.p1  ORF type:complete len:132 (+),score=36.05 TRINITY_DN3022_c0_g1_i2:123-518(+)
MTLFSYNWPFAITLRVFDCFFSEGIKVIFRIGIAVLKLQARELARTSFEDLLMKFRDLPMAYGDESGLEALFKCAFGLKITRKQLEVFSAKFEEMEAENRRKQEEARAKYHAEKEEKEEEERRRREGDESE